MNVFDAIYLGNNDPIDRQFIAAETEMDITIARANKEYMLESGLIELSDNTLFMESSDSSIKTKRENSFIKVVKSICTAIRNFIGDIVSTIAGMFDNRENITAEDYLESPTGKIQLEKDIRAVERIVSDEIRKGNKLLQKVSQLTGISDEAIDNWVKEGTEKIAKLAPVIIPAAMGFGFKKLFSAAFKDSSKAVDDAEREATSGDTSDPKKTSQVTKILNHMHSLVKTVGSTAADWMKTMNKAKKKAK